MDAIQLIRRDHRIIEALFKSFERAGEDLGARRRLGREIVRELSIHAGIEEQFVYPALRRAGREAEVLAALEEHHATKVTLSELEAMPVASERFVPKMSLLIDNVRAHVVEEERDLLPQLERALDAGQRDVLGRTLEAAKRVAPTRPHPAAPDMPPGNFVANAMAAVVDRARDAARGGAELLWHLAGRGVGTGARALAVLMSRGQQGVSRAGAEVRDTGREGLAQLRELPRELVGDFEEQREQGRRALQESVRDVARARSSKAHAAAAGAREKGRNGARARQGRNATTH